MIETAGREAIDVLLDQRPFVLDSAAYDAFQHVLDNPPDPGPNLRSLLRRIALASQSIGIGAVLVHARSDGARRFYQTCAKVIEYPADSRILFLPIETVIAGFG
ncbi:MAG: DUF1778 domain-containing protein [Rhodospirillales bacterium]|nr:DUF1778 domain-containing protein [Rhodospirillales bacterium]